MAVDGAPAVHLPKTPLTREYFASPTIGMEKSGDALTYKGIGKDFYKQHGTEKPDDGNQNGFCTLAALDPSDPAHVQTLFERKCIEYDVDPKLDPGRGTLLYDWCEKAATLERHFLACEHLQSKGGLKHARHKDLFGSGDSAALFPAFVESQIAAALIVEGIVSDVLMSIENAGASSVLTFEFQDTEQERGQSRVSIGGKLPRKTPTTGEGPIQLGKWGMSFPVPYEMRAQSSIETVNFHIRRIGQQIAVDQSDYVMDIAIAGDGSGRNGGAAETNATDTDVAAAGTIAYSDMLTWCYAGGKAHTLDIAVAGGTDLALIANLAEFKDPDVGRSVSRTQFKSPLNIRYVQWDGGATNSNYVDRLVVGFDRRNAMKGYNWGPNIQETDRLIEDQLDVYTFSHWFGVAKMVLLATEVLDTNTAL